jgi:hypothetical protein
VPLAGVARPRPNSPHASSAIGGAVRARSAAALSTLEAETASSELPVGSHAPAADQLSEPLLASNSGALAKPESTLERAAPEPSPDSALAGAFSVAVQAPSPALEPAAGDEWFVGINGVPVGPIKLAELRAKAAAGAINKESLVWRDGFEEWKALGAFPELVAIVEEGSSSARASLAPMTPPPNLTAMSATVPRAVVDLAPGASISIVPGEDLDELEQMAGLRRKSSFSLAQVFAMVVAIMFGLTVGFVVFSGTEKTKEVVKYVEVPSQAQKGAESTSQVESETAAQDEADADDDKQPKQIAKTGKGTKSTPTPAGENTGLKGLSGLSGLSPGPASGPQGNTATNSNSGKPLDSAAVQGTVRRYTGSVKRSCWQPALDTRDANAPTAARVAVTITVGGSGAVQNVSTSGDPRGYRGLATCIARRVRGWQFPASTGPTTVNVPFVFAAQ